MLLLRRTTALSSEPLGSDDRSMPFATPANGSSSRKLATAFTSLYE